MLNTLLSVLCRGDPKKFGSSGFRGAFHSYCGLELLLAARLAHLFEEDFAAPRGRWPSNLDNYLQAPLIALNHATRPKKLYKADRADRYRCSTSA